MLISTYVPWEMLGWTSLSSILKPCHSNLIPGSEPRNGKNSDSKGCKDKEGAKSMAEEGRV